MLNTNSFHNILNLGLAVLAGLEGFQWYTLFDSETSLKVAAFIGITKLAINIYRDGLTGLVKVQPPVVAPTEVK